MGLHKRLGSRIRELRHATGLSQAQVAEAVGVSNEHMSRVERGVKGLSLENLERLCGVLNCEMKTLFDFGLSSDSRTVRAEALVGVLANADDETFDLVHDIVMAVLRAKKRAEQ